MGFSNFRPVAGWSASTFAEVISPCSTCHQTSGFGSGWIPLQPIQMSFCFFALMMSV
jgi:hypothetical protein